MEEEIFNVGDYYVYDIVYFFFLIVCIVFDEIKVYWNVCLYRGRKLCICEGKGVKNICCVFYGWLWNFDGLFKEILC